MGSPLRNHSREQEELQQLKKYLRKSLQDKILGEEPITQEVLDRIKQKLNEIEESEIYKDLWTSNLKVTVKEAESLEKGKVIVSFERMWKS